MALHRLYSSEQRQMPDVFQYDVLPSRLRTQIYWLWESIVKQNMDPELFAAVKEAVCAEHGWLQLMPQNYRYAYEEVCDFFLNENSDLMVSLDIVQLSMFYCCVWLEQHGMMEQAAKAVEEVNHRFKENGVGYEFLWPDSKLIRLDNTLLHQEVLRPALLLLRDSAFANANAEFMAALEDYKNGQFGDALTKGSSAFESVIKIIAHNNGWQYDERDTAGRLIQIYIANTGLPGFFQQQLVGIPQFRNNLSTAHGAGTLTRSAEEHSVRYFLFHVAAAMVMLIEEAP